MQSSGDTIAAEQAVSHAVRLLLSGPAGGLTALRFLAQLIASEHLLSFDMGGTSTDVSLFAGEIETTQEGRIGSYPVAVPMVDMHTIGAGGGSIATVDSAGMLQVGPASAGADPGPACYGRSGVHATVTDANVVLGRIPEHTLLASSMPISRELAVAAVSCLADELGLSVSETALGIVQLANEHMVEALRVISVNRGHDVSEFSLTCFGGAGGLHVCDLADSLRMSNALVPVHGGVLSAVGMAVAQQGQRFTQTVVDINFCGDPDTVDKQVNASFAKLETDARLRFPCTEPDLLELSRQVELCYRGQSFTLAVQWQNCEQASSEFHQQHRRRYGYDLPSEIELVNLQIKVALPNISLQLPRVQTSQTANSSNKDRTSKVYGVEKPVPCLQRDSFCEGQLIRGPAIVQEQVATTYIAPRWQARVDEFGNLLLNKTQ